MGKVDYIYILEPKVERITADNPRDAEEKIREKCPAVKNIILFPRKLGYLNGKYIKP